MNEIAKEKTRFKSQQQRILDRLRKGQATNAALAKISLKYTGRISDLRKAGHDIQVVKRNHQTGLVTYRLMD